MSNLLKLRARAKKLDPVTRSLDHLLRVPEKENLTMALFICSYPEYQEWRQSMLRQRIPGHSFSTEEFLLGYVRYSDEARKWSESLEILEKHFSLVCPERYEPLEDVAKTLFFEDYVDLHVARLLYQVGDNLLRFRHEDDITFLLPAVDLLDLLFSWYRSENQEMWFLRLWRNVFFLFYRNQRDLVLSDMPTVENLLEREYDLCSLLPQTSSFYIDILENIMTRCAFFPIVFPDVLDFHHVLRGVVLYRPEFVPEWETMISAAWEANPWMAVARTTRFLEECDVTGNDVRKAVLQSFQRHIRVHTSLLAKTLVHHRDCFVPLFQYGGESLQDVVHALVFRVWNHRHDAKALRDARFLLGRIRGVDERISWSLSSMVHDLSESLLYDRPRYRVFLCRNPMVSMLPTDEIECPETRGFKEEFLKTYREAYPCRKIQWLDWQSTVELVGGIRMFLVHVMVLRLVDTHGPLRIHDLCTRLGWSSVYVRGIVHSLVAHKHQPLLECDNDVVSLRPLMMMQSADYPLPQFPNAKGVACTSSFDETLFLEAFLVRFLKRNGDAGFSDLVENINENPRTLAVSSSRVEQVLDGLIRKEYARRDEEGRYHYVA